MELRHLRFYIAVAEELHFARAARRLHIEQSPLSRAIKDLEYDLGVQLLERTTRSTRMTWAGEVFLQEARRILLAIEQAKISARSAANGYRGHLRIAISDSIAQPRISKLLARCREEEPEVEIRIFNTMLDDQIKGLQTDVFDAGLAHCNDVEEGIEAKPIWRDDLVVAVPPHHPILKYPRIPLEEATRYPVVLYHHKTCRGLWCQLIRRLGFTDHHLTIAGRVPSLEMMVTLVAAGYGLGFASEKQLAVYQNSKVIIRPLAHGSPSLTTYLLRPDKAPSEELDRFIQRLLDRPVDSYKPSE